MNFNKFIQVYVCEVCLITREFPGPTSHEWIKLIEDAHRLLFNEIPGIQEMYDKRYDISFHLASLVYFKFFLWNSYNNKMILNRERRDIRWKFSEEDLRIGTFLFRMKYGFPLHP